MSNTPQNPANNFLHLKEELEKCLRCGECRSVCPVFDATRNEKFAARGKIALLMAAADGDIGLSDSFSKGLSNCLLCMACVANCSNNVPTDKLVVQGRTIFAFEHGLPILQRIIYGSLAGAGAGAPAFKAAHTMQKILFKKLPNTSGMRRRFPLPLVDAGQHLPELAETPFRDANPPSPPGANTKNHVLFFTGCMSNYAYTNISEAVLKVLKALGKEVVIPEQHCCGAPMYLSGDVQKAQELAHINTALLSQFSDSIIVVACPTCGMMLKKHLPELVSKKYLLKAESIAPRTMDISEFLIHSVGLDVIRRHISQPVLRTITYHDPCHLNRGQGIHQEPRDLLTLVCGTLLREMEDADRCCGLAGTYSLLNRKTSQLIQKKKSEKLRQSGADLVATGCPGCIMQLQDGAGRIGVQCKVRHTIEILAQAMGLL